jgi:hypothetical protein
MRRLWWLVPAGIVCLAGFVTALLTHHGPAICVTPAARSAGAAGCPRPGWANWQLVLLASITAALAVGMTLLLRHRRQDQ